MKYLPTPHLTELTTPAAARASYLDLSSSRRAQVQRIERLARRKSQEAVFLLHAVGLLDSGVAEPLDIGQAAFDAAMATGVVPKYVTIAGLTYRRTSRGIRCMTKLEWAELSTQEPLTAPTGTDIEMEVLGRILETRLGAPHDKFNGACEVLSVPEILDEVGVDAPSTGQLACSDALLRDLVGSPKLVRGEPRFRVSFHDDGQWPDQDIVLLYPVPPSDWTFCNFVTDQSDAASRGQPLIGPTWSPLSVGALIY